MKILQQQFLKKLTEKLLVFVILITLITPSLSGIALAATGTDQGLGRTRSCDSNGKPDKLDWDPTTAGKDAEFDMSNPVCLGIIIGTYALVKSSIALMNGLCGTGSAIPRIRPSPLHDAWDLGRGGVKAATSADAKCIAGVATATTSWSAALVVLLGIYTTAAIVYDTTTVCGAKWTKPNPRKYNFSGSGTKQEVQEKIDGYFRDDQSKLNMNDKYYRQWYYGGEEVEDNPETGDACYDVTVPKVGGSYPRQKYYMSGNSPGNFNCKKYDLVAGQNDPINSKPLTTDRLAELQAAYACCKKRSKEYICIDYGAASAVTGGSTTGLVDHSKVFCRAGSLCTIEGITFSTKSLDQGRLICAETYSLCPYNFALGGGSEYCDYYQDGKWDSSSGKWTMITPEDLDSGNCASKSEIRNSDCTYNDKTNRCKNYCQYLTHCTKTSNADYHYKSSLGSPYFSDACINFIGDSQNKTSLNTGFVLGSQRHFSAPIAQCMKETLENVFYNRIGHTKCYGLNEFPSADGTCPSGQYAITTDGLPYKRGDQAMLVSFFSKMQNTLQDVVKMILVFSVTFLGMNILIGKTDVRNKKELMMYVLKIGLVLYFATGDAWQTVFFKGVYGASNEFSMMVFKINAGNDEKKRDGCQFGYISNSSGEQISSGRLYPPGKEYLALWDTLDCKIMRYLGFGPEASAANIVMVILAGYFTGAIGMYFAMAVMFFGFFFLAATLRALHIFLASAVSIIIMVFVSPLIIPLCLFERTKSIYNNWLKELISFCLQPMILFAYIAFFITIMDKTMVGSATYAGPGPNKGLSCSVYCKNLNGTIEPYTASGEPPACDQKGQKEVNPMNDSVVCLISANTFGEFPGLALIGVGIPIITGIFDNSAKEKILTILKGALMMYLLHQFMDEITNITSALIGGTALPGTQASALDMFTKAVGFATEASKRIGGGIKQGGKKANEKRKGMSKGASAAANSGKSTEDGGGTSKGGGGDGGKEDSVAEGGGGNDEVGGGGGGEDEGGGGGGGNDEGGGGGGGNDEGGGGGGGQDK